MCWLDGYGYVYSKTYWEGAGELYCKCCNRIELVKKGVILVFVEGDWREFGDKGGLGYGFSDRIESPPSPDVWKWGGWRFHRVNVGLGWF